MPIEPGTLCDLELPWEARLDEKLWRLMTPEKPLPCEVPCTSTIWPAVKISALTAAPGWNAAASSAFRRNSRTTEPASTPAFA